MRYMTYNQNDRFAFFIETYINAAIQVLRFKNPSVCNICAIQNVNSYCKAEERRLSRACAVLVTAFTALTPKIEPVHRISNKVVCATSKASDQPAHTRSLIRVIASRLNILLVLSF